MDRLSATFSALADPTRRAILARLVQGDASVGELAAPFAISLPAVSKHLRVLERAALIERRIDAQWRVCRLCAEPLQEVDDWVEHYRQFWSGGLDRLAAFLRADGSTPATPSRARTARRAATMKRRNR